MAANDCFTNKTFGCSNVKKTGVSFKIGFFKKKEVHYFELAHLFEANIPTLIPGG